MTSFTPEYIYHCVASAYHPCLHPNMVVFSNVNVTSFIYYNDVVSFPYEKYHVFHMWNWDNDM